MVDCSEILSRPVLLSSCCCISCLVVVVDDEKSRRSHDSQKLPTPAVQYIYHDIINMLYTLPAHPLQQGRGEKRLTGFRERQTISLTTRISFIRAAASITCLIAC